MLLVVIDLTLVNGMDTSAIDLFGEILAMCNDHNCSLFLAGLNPDLKAELQYAKVIGIDSSVHLTSDLESALARAEDNLLSNIFRLEAKNEAESRKRGRSLSIAQDDGFLYALRKIDELHGLNTTEELADLKDWITPLELEPGEVLTREPGMGGIYFVETGLMRVRHAYHTSTLNSYTTSATLMGPTPMSATSSTTPLVAGNDPTLSLGHMNARSRALGRQVVMWKQEHAHDEQTFRLARIGQGWIIGGIEAFNGMRQPGIHVAMSHCRLHYLPQSAMKQAEQINPTLAMHLYKMLSHLSTKRQERTIQQLDQFVKILKSPAPRLNGGGKSALSKLTSL